MAIADDDIAKPEDAMRATIANGPRATAAQYDRRRARVVVTLDNGLELAFPPRLAEGLAGAKPDTLAAIEITLIGHGLHHVSSKKKKIEPFKLRGASFKGNGRQKEFEDAPWNDLRDLTYEGRCA